MDKVTSGDDMLARIEECVLEVAMSATNHINQTINRLVAFSNELAQVNNMENKTSNTLWAAKVPRKKAPCLNIEDFKLFGKSTLDNTLLASQERESCKLTISLLLKANTVSIPNNNHVAMTTPAALKKTGMTRSSAFSRWTDHIAYTQFWNAWASRTITRNIHWQKLPMSMDRGSMVCVISEEVARELNIGWKCADCKIITPDGNQ